MRRIAVIIGKMHSGGKKNLVMEYYRHIDKSKYQFDFICDSDSNAIPENEILKYGGRIFKIAPIQHIFKHIHELDNVFKNGEYEIMHAYNNLLNIFPLLTARKNGVGIRISESISTGSRGEFKTIAKKILRPLSHLGATHMAACSTDSGIYQFGEKAVNGNKVSVFKTVIDARANQYDSELRKLTRQEYCWNDKIVYGFIGRYEKQKNTLYLIEIMAAISRKQDNAQFAFIGSGSMENEMLVKIKALNIKDKVSWLGRREDIKKFYNSFDAFLLPSLYEGLPVVSLESQACGLPIFLSSKITNEAVCTEVAKYIDITKDPAEIADLIINETKSLGVSRKSHFEELISSGYDSISEAIRLSNFYDNIIDNP